MNKSTIERRDKVYAYNSNIDLSPLLFKQGENIFSIPNKKQLKFNKDKTPNRKQLIRLILLATQEYYSYNPSTKRFETPPNKNRSIIDIWRHAKSLYPDIDIFKLMEAMHSLCESGEVFGQYCKIIKRAVFRSHNLKDTNMSFTCKEYSIIFNSWRNLHE